MWNIKYISCLTTSESYNDNATVQTADIATVQFATPGCQSKINSKLPLKVTSSHPHYMLKLVFIYYFKI